jgi:hypothetical protein
MFCFFPSLLLVLFSDLKTTLSRIDTGRNGPKTKSRINTEGFDGVAASDLVSSLKPAAPAPVVQQQAPIAVANSFIAPSSESNIQDFEAELARLRAQLQESAAFAVRLEAQIREGWERKPNRNFQKFF